jgi:hypothetical protein
MKKENGNVWWFFLIAIGFTWLFELPRTLDSKGIIESPALLLHLARYLGLPEKVKIGTQRPVLTDSYNVP